VRLLPLVLITMSCTVSPEVMDGDDPAPMSPISPAGSQPAGAACARDDECAGGTCLGTPGREAENPRFAGGYCTRTGCTPNTQEGCGPDELCVDTGDPAVLGGGYCVELCSRADGVTCDRADHVCLGLGHIGGCFSNQAVDCDRNAGTGCEKDEICVRIGFEEDSPLGRCETRCDPVGAPICGADRSCYYIKAYNDAFCGITGTTAPDERCLCDKCCVDGHACTPDGDGVGRHCKRYCTVANPTECSADERCIPIEINQDTGYVSAVGGCSR
jgi:hypothetical protein